MPTARGLSVALVGIGLWVTGRLLGAPPLEQMGFGLFVLVIAAVLVLRLGRHDIRVTRAISPQKVTAGREVEVGLRLDNLGEGATPLTLLEDDVASHLGNRPRFILDGLRPGDRRQVRFTLRPRRRGRWRVGPLRMTFKDPFGLARVASSSRDSTEFLVYPKIESLVLPQFATNRRSRSRSARRQLTGSRGEDFYTLREYVEGDDLRRIHWPATAKRGRYMIRQEETPWQARATILLDDRSSAHSRATWERALEAAASFADMFVRSGYVLTLATAHTQGRGPSRGEAHLHRCLEMLVTLEPTRPGSDPAGDPLAARLGAFTLGASSDDVLIAILGNPDGPGGDALIRAAARCRATAAILIEGRPPGPAASEEARGPSDALQAAGIKVLRLPVASALAGPWQALWSRPGGVPRHEGGEAWEPKPAPA